MCVRSSAGFSESRKSSDRESRTVEAPTRTMSSAGDRLYKEFLLKKLPTIVSRVKAREIVVHLHCLTDHDRENIEAKREVCGNYDSMVLLLDCLKRRENWPEQFIDALETCGHPAIAAEIREKYDALRGVSNSSSSSPPANVVQAHVHPAPSAAHLPVPETGASSGEAAPPAAAPPAAAPPAAEASPPVDAPTPPQAAQPAAAHVPEVDAAPEPEPPLPGHIQAPPAPSTPPPSPEIPRVQETTKTPPPPRETVPHQEPVEDSETDVQDVSVDIPPPSGPVEVSDVDSAPGPDPEVRPESPPPAQILPEVKSSVHIETPEKPPVQDTSPPAAVLLPEQDPEAAAAQLVESTPQTASAAGTGGHLLPDTDVCLSKPGQLLSVHPEDPGSPTLPAHSPAAEPYSGDSGRLEMSADPQTPAHSAPRCTPPPCQENGVAAVNHNEPEENHYESPFPSLDVRQNVVQIHQEPSILDMDGQTFRPQLVNGEAAKEIPSAAPPSSDAADPVSGVDPPSGDSYCPPEPEKPATRSLPVNTKYILTAAGVGACAMLLAWRLKN